MRVAAVDADGADDPGAGALPVVPLRDEQAARVAATPASEGTRVQEEETPQPTERQIMIGY